jgi:hypothetical protein
MRQYTSDGIIWDENHPKRCRKKDGTPYIVIPTKVKKEMQAAGTWPELYTSVTEYLKVLSSQHLINWAMGVGVKATLACDSRDEAECMKAAMALRDQPADKGKEIHAALEAELSAIHNPALREEIADPVCAAAAANLTIWLENNGLISRIRAGHFRSEDGFACELEGIRFGGTRDLVIDSMMVIDFKTTRNERSPYESELGQIAAYVKSLGPHSPQVRGVELYFSSVTGALMKEHGWLPHDIEFGWTLFKKCAEIAMMQEQFKEMI